MYTRKQIKGIKATIKTYTNESATYRFEGTQAFIYYDSNDDSYTFCAGQLTSNDVPVKTFEDGLQLVFNTIAI